MIATPVIKEQMDIQDASVDPTDHKARWDKGYNTLMNWARRKMLDAQGSKSSKMDIGNVMPQPESPYGKGTFGGYEQPMMAMGKGGKGYGGKGFMPYGKGGKYGGGKGGFGKGQYGGKGYTPYKGGKFGGGKGGFGKGFGKKGGGTIFYGSCVS